MLGFVKRHANRDFDTKSRRALYLTLIRPTIGYATQVWAPSEVNDIKAIESLQRRSTKFILRNPNMNYRRRLIKLNLLPVSFWYEINDLSFFYKCINGEYSFPINQYVKPKSMIRETRNSCELDMVVPICKTKLFQNSFFNRIPKLWNMLPPSTRSSPSASSFKYALYKRYWYALENSYSPDTYNTWKSVCPKCSSSNDLLTVPSCCY